MAENDAKVVREENILTERKFPRRSFLTATGALLAGAVAVASSIRASAATLQQQSDPDQTDKKKAAKKTSKASKSKKTAKKTAKKAKPAPKSDPDGSRL